MGIFDAIEKIGSMANKVDRGINTAERTARTADRMKGMAGKAAGMLDKKCKICKTNPLKTDIEKQKGVCVSCAMSQM